MLPIIDFPKVVKQFGDSFKEVFSFHQLRRFKQYLTGLITSENKTVAGISSNLVDNSDQSSINRFLTEYDWDTEELNDKRLELLQSNPETQWNKKGVVSIDDTLLHKTGKKMPGAGKLFDHAEGRCVHAQNIVTSNYVDKYKEYPINLRQSFKHDSEEAKQQGFKTKINLAMELVRDCEKRGIPVVTYVYDNWFLCRELAECIESYGKNWVSRIKSNRIIFVSGERMSVSEFEKTIPRNKFKEIEVKDKTYWTFTKVVSVSKLSKLRLVISYDNKELEGNPAFLVTNCKYWDAKRIVYSYSLRFSIETFYKDTKQNLGLGSCQLRSLEGTRRHWSLVNSAYSLLKIDICNSKVYRRLESDMTIGTQCREASKDLLESLVLWVYRNASKNVDVNRILWVLLG